MSSAKEALAKYHALKNGKTRGVTASQAIALGRAGMDLAWENSSGTWKHRAWEALCEFAREGVEFNPDDIRDRVGEPLGSPNVMGALFARAKRRGLIRVVGMRPARQERAHGRMTFVYSGTTKN